MQTWILVLNEGEFLDSSLNIVEKLCKVRFHLGSSLFGQNVDVFSNCPLTPNDEFNRDKYAKLIWQENDNNQFCEIQAWNSGSYHYFFTTIVNERSQKSGGGYILVNPVLKVGNNNEVISLDAINCQTVLTKLLGEFSTWSSKLEVSYQAGYNMLHFSPIQELGNSNSSYSIRNQLKLNKNLSNVTFDNVKSLIKVIQSEWKMLSICDIVINHTSNDSPWLIEHPESAYNLCNSKHLRPAYLLDIALFKFSVEIGKGIWRLNGIPYEIESEEHLKAIRNVLLDEVVPILRIHEFYQCDVEQLVAEFKRLRESEICLPKNENTEKLKLIQNESFERFQSQIDMNLAMDLFRSKSIADFEMELINLNKLKYNEINEHLTAAIENFILNVNFNRLDKNGPRSRGISKKNPLVDRYFVEFNVIEDYDNIDLYRIEKIVFDDSLSKFFMAHNGWVMNFDPLSSFISANMNVYLRRELIVWGDSVKLNYGSQLSDNPFLWTYMQKYVEIVAEIFDGIRIDNCHSVSVPAASYLVDCARKINPDLYIIAELFTGSVQTDNLFINKLGINSLIRESMSAWDSHELGRLVYRYGGEPIGSFYRNSICQFPSNNVAHAIFYDVTHDNQSLIMSRTAIDCLPRTALVFMASCAAGSTRGFDELVPHQIDVVNEQRLYTSWSFDNNIVAEDGYINKNCGLIAAKKLICNLHKILGNRNFNQVFVDQMDKDIVAVTRHNPESHESYILVAFTSFLPICKKPRNVKPIEVEGELIEIVLEAEIVNTNLEKKFQKDKNWINGLENYEVKIEQNIPLEKSKFLQKNSSNSETLSLLLKNFTPGSLVVFHVRPSMKTIAVIQQFLKKPNELLPPKINFNDLNFALYQCDKEGQCNNNGIGVYNVPNYGPLVYCGLQGVMSLLTDVVQNNDLGHPICENLRKGNWLIDYIWERYPDGNKLKKYLQQNLDLVKKLPRYLIPCYFEFVVKQIHNALLQKSYDLMNEFVSCGSTFIKNLAMGSIQFTAFIEFAKFNTVDIDQKLTLCAGLPHFSVGYMRNWGRDTFISLRGIFLLTGRYDDAKNHILAYASCLRHGLIPNLLNQAENARYNCRDAVWWWLYSIKCYVEEAPNGYDILTTVTPRFYPTDDSVFDSSCKVQQPLLDIMQEAIQVHFQGLKFRERNAGTQIDEVMIDAGFNIEIGVSLKTGFVYGGNEFNCGTWMDKMGSSKRAENFGKPATSRDGSAVELVALTMTVITWLNEIYQKGKYPYGGVEKKDGTVTIQWTYKDWSERILDNFEEYFWIDDNDKNKFVNRRFIYKDSVNASQEWTDYQLRCNFVIAMALAPEMFDAKRAWAALNVVEDVLTGPIGLKTLDPSDWNYRPDYDNSNDTNDFYVASGFNYHQGPEWVWPIGYYLRARLKFARLFGKAAEVAEVQYVKSVLSQHIHVVESSFWRSLPELTNGAGKMCPFSSDAQAWSVAAILEVMFEINQLEMKYFKHKN